MLALFCKPSCLEALPPTVFIMYVSMLLLRRYKYSLGKVALKKQRGCPYVHVQWNIYITDTLGTTRSVLIKGVSSFQRLFCTHLYVAGTMDSVLIKEVSLFQRSLIERFHCAQYIVLESESTVLKFLSIALKTIQLQCTGWGNHCPCWAVTDCSNNELNY